MTLDPNTLVPLGVAVPCVLWIGHRLIQATRAATNLSRDFQDFKDELKRLADSKVDAAYFDRYMERLGYKNPTLQMPPAKGEHDEAA